MGFLGNTDESYAKILEDNLSYYLSPILMGARDLLVMCYQQFPFLSVIGTSAGVFLGYIGINRFQSRKEKRQDREREESIRQIPRIVRDVQEMKQTMHAVNSSALANATATLGFSNVQREQTQRLVNIQLSLEDQEKINKRVDETTTGISRAVGVLPGYGDKLNKLEAQGSSIRNKVGEIAGLTSLRPRADS